MKLTQIARKTIEFYFKHKKFDLDRNIRSQYNEKRACFVTLTKNGDLRGCIGFLYAVKPLWESVQENALNAALNDPRFPSLEEDELKYIKIEISILTNPLKLEFKNTEELLSKINHKMGIILKKGLHSSTFLPQVWEKIPEKVKFLEQLSLKAGLDKNAWKEAELFYYNVEVEEE